MYFFYSLFIYVIKQWLSYFLSIQCEFFSLYGLFYWWSGRNGKWLCFSVGTSFYWLFYIRICGRMRIRSMPLVKCQMLGKTRYLGKSFMTSFCLTYISGSTSGIHLKLGSVICLHNRSWLCTIFNSVTFLAYILQTGLLAYVSGTVSAIHLKLESNGSSSE